MSEETKAVAPETQQTETPKEEVKVETPEYKPGKTYEGTFIQGAFVGKETTPKKLKKTDLMINMP